MPSRVQLNTVARPPYESFAKPLTHSRMKEIKREIEKVYNKPVDILAGTREKEMSDSGNGRRDFAEIIPPAKVEAEISEMLLRRPCTVSEIAATLNMNNEEIGGILADMTHRNCLKVKIHGGKKYYRTVV
jgi:wyosine [tRNA(Phe)-imidazoG37] synthetase (radical SAM superfamily)